MEYRMASLQVPARDGFDLSAFLFEPKDDIKAGIQFHTGIGVKKELYVPFCSYLAESGYAVVVFDYRGIGGSRPVSLKGFQASISDWGLLDSTGVMDWLADRYPAHPRFIVAHSMGGQLIGLMDNNASADGIIVFSGTMGNWRNYSGSYKLFAGLLWFFYFPLCIRLFGYVPMKKIRMGEDLPEGVAHEWYLWCRGNEIHSTYLEKQGQAHHFRSVCVPIKAYYIEHDVLATSKSIPLFRKDYPNAEFNLEILNTREAGPAGIGHLGFFSRKHRDTLWGKPRSVIDGWCRSFQSSLQQTSQIYGMPYRLKKASEDGKPFTQQPPAPSGRQPSLDIDS